MEKPVERSIFQWMEYLLFYKINTSACRRETSSGRSFWPSFVKRTWVPLKECKKLTLSLSLKKPLVQATSWICLPLLYFSPLLGLMLSQCVSLYSWKYNNFHKCISYSVQWIFRTLQPLSKRDFFSSEKIGSKGPKWKLRRQRWERNFQLFEGS